MLRQQIAQGSQDPGLHLDKGLATSTGNVLLASLLPFLGPALAGLISMQALPGTDVRLSPSRV
jgi:hypothetical protein